MNPSTFRLFRRVVRTVGKVSPDVGRRPTDEPVRPRYPRGVRCLVAIVALVAAGCGASPTAPTDDAPTVTLSIHLYGHISQRPIAGELVALVTEQDIWTPGGPRPILLPQRTDAQGRVAWRVPPGHVYPVQVRGVQYFTAVVVPPVDAGWLLSMPE